MMLPGGIVDVCLDDGDCGSNRKTAARICLSTMLDHLCDVVENRSMSDVVPPLRLLTGQIQGQGE